MNEPIVAIFELLSFNPNLAHAAIKILQSQLCLQIHPTTDMVYHVILFDWKAGSLWGDYY